MLLEVWGGVSAIFVSGSCDLGHDATFLPSFVGLWSLVKRAPKATKKRKVFEVPGPKAEGDVMGLDARARQVCCLPVHPKACSSWCSRRIRAQSIS